YKRHRPRIHRAGCAGAELEVQRYRNETAADHFELRCAADRHQALAVSTGLPARNAGGEADVGQTKRSARAERRPLASVGVWEAQVAVDRDARAALGIIPDWHTPPSSQHGARSP